MLNTLKTAQDIKKSDKVKYFDGVKVFCIDQIKPFNKKLLIKIIRNNPNSSFISVEENMLNGGLGSIIKQNLSNKKIDLINFAINDKFVDAGDKIKCLKESGINPEKIISLLNKIQ